MAQTRCTRQEIPEMLRGGAIGELVNQIMAAYDVYQDAMEEQISAGDDLRTAEINLESFQDRVLLDGQLDGKNAETRAAQLRTLTDDQYVAHQLAEARYQRARLVTTQRYELLRTLRAISSLTSGTSHA